MYADDVTQVITLPSKLKLMMKVKVEREIERINKFERRWKTETNEDKFKIIPIPQLKNKENQRKWQRNRYLQFCKTSWLKYYFQGPCGSHKKNCKQRNRDINLIKKI